MRSLFIVINALYSVGFVRVANRLARLGKLSFGLYNKHFTTHKTYEKSWWDEDFYGSTVLDKNTISNSIDEYATAYHYASIEQIIAQEFFNRKDTLTILKVLDIGSGSGHWIDFYHRIGATNLIGLDVSRKAIDVLKKKYAKQDVRLIHGEVTALQSEMIYDLDAVNAIGVMFHIVDDDEWNSSLKTLHATLKRGGVLVVGGHFGVLDGINVQIDQHGRINKRLRSKRNWEKTLKAIGFKDIKYVNNSAAYSIKRVLPENNILIAIKS